MQQGLHDEIRACLSIGEYSGLYSVCERNYAPGYHDKDVVVIYLFSTYLTHNLHQARGIWLSLSPSFRQDPTILATWNLGKSLIQRNFKTVYEILDGTQWQSAASLAATFRIQFSQQMIKTVAKAYSSLTIASACELLGLSTESLISLCNSYGWTVSGDLVYPKSPKAESANPVSAADIERLTNLLAFLENNINIGV
jgi:hypothetical protein